MPGPDCFGELRDTLRDQYAVPLPDGAPGPGFDADAARAAFLAFAGFVKGNLGGQTGLRVDPVWASQSNILQGMGQIVLPDLILREEDAASRLSELAATMGLSDPGLSLEAPQAPVGLAEIYDAEIEAAVRGAYQRDYMMFGWGAYA